MLIGLFLLTGNMVIAQAYQFENNWGEPGYSIVKQNQSDIEVNYSIREFSVYESEIDGENYHNIILSGNMLPNDEGAPDLPGTSRYIAVPQGATARLVINDYRMEVIKDVDMAPAPRIPLDTDDSPLHYEKNQDIFSTDAFYPTNPIQISEQTVIRGVNAVILGITPFQYNPVTKELRVYTDVQVDIVFDGGNGYFGDDRLRSRWWDPIIQDVFLNSASIPEIDYNKRFREITSTRDDAGCEYLIVVPNNAEFSEWADSIKIFRQKQGITTM
nr:hypothetical protein [Bacteroidota bacterium]